MLRKVLSFEIKEVRDRVLEFVGSTEDKDRMGDVIMASGWQLKNYKKNPVFLWAHKYDQPPVGKAVKVWLDDNRLKFHIQFATPEEYEFADTIYKLYKGGFLRATSVGFMPMKSEPIEKEDEDSFMTPTRFLKQDLLELSACPVPANPNALAEARAKGLVGDKEFSRIAWEEVAMEDETDDLREESMSVLCEEEHKNANTTSDGANEETITEQFPQAEIADEIDYLRSIIEVHGLNEDNTKEMWLLVEDLLRLSGGEIPVEIAGKLREVETPPAPELTEDDIKDLITKTVGNVIAQARGITYGGTK